MLSIDYISKAVQNSTGIKIDANLQRLPDKDLIHVRPYGFDPNRGIRIESSLKWRTLKSTLVFEDYAQDVVDHIISKEERVDVYKDIVESYGINRAKRIVNYEIGESPMIKLSIEESPIDVRVKSAEEHISKQCIDILNAILVFFELKEEDVSNTEEGVPEGAKTTVEVNKFERSRINRSACINHFGSICQACNFDFEKVYGNIGKGYIHVHHLVPVSEMGGEYVINPIKDLIPLCPNCHAMVHKRTPPFSVEELKTIRHTTKPKLH